MFRLLQVHPSGARTGELATAHGVLRTPFFMPIATKGAVKTLSAPELAQLESAVDADAGRIVLANTYHLYLKPGLEILAQAGGLHAFMNWNGALLTDSGGFQIFSLSGLRTVTEDGVSFRSHIDGSTHVITPEWSMEIQSVIGADLWMAFDYFPGYPATHAEVEESVTRTTSWARRCKEWYAKSGAAHPERAQQLFGIIQGSTDKELRTRSAQELLEIGFDGYAVGGLAVGEPEEAMIAVLEHTVSLLPRDAPRYLMGVGTPDQLLAAVKRGVDMFDCVLPTRNARHGTVFVHDDHSPHIVSQDLSGVTYKKINIKSETYSKQFVPLDAHCVCATCAGGFSRAYLRHLFSVDEPLAARLATIHNVTFYLTLMKEIRAIIQAV